MKNRFYRWEIALLAGVLVGALNLSAGAKEIPVSRWTMPREYNYARYQISVRPFAVGHGTGEVMAPESAQKEAEMEIRYYFPELWERIRDAIGL